MEYKYILVMFCGFSTPAFISVEVYCIYGDTIMQVYRVKVLSGYRVTIPRDVRSKLGVKVGDEVELRVEGGRIIIQVAGLPSDPVLEMLGMASGGKQRIGGVEEAVIEELREKVERG